MKKYEYCVKTLETKSFEELTNTFNDLGSEGWEIVNIEHNYNDSEKYNYIVWFKKEK